MTTQEDIEKMVKEDDVVLFMKGSPLFPQCGFSSMAVQVLEHLGVKFQSHNVLDDMEMRDGIKTFANWPTIPQLYVKGEFVGGADIMREMFESGELQSYMSDKGVVKAEA